MVNNVTLVGRLTKTPEVKFTEGNSVPYLFFDFAVKRNRKNNEGEKEVDFIPAQAWRNVAAFIGAYVETDSIIGLRGEIRTRFTGEGDNKTKVVYFYANEVYPIHLKTNNNDVPETVKDEGEGEE